MTAAGTGGTLAGLLAGLRLAESPLRVLGIDIGRLWTDFPETVARVASETCAHLGSPVTFAPEQVPLIEETYVGEAYGTPSEDGVAAIRRLAATEGLILDPVYTGKAFAGLLDLAQRGRAGPRRADHLRSHRRTARALRARRDAARAIGFRRDNAREGGTGDVGPCEVASGSGR